jgi:hypothetical protein
MALKKSELYSSLWASCDELRGAWMRASTRTMSRPAQEVRNCWDRRPVARVPALAHRALFHLAQSSQGQPEGRPRQGLTS